MLSDLHLEFADFTPCADGYDIVVLAGDINVRRKGRAHGPEQYPALGWVEKHFSSKGVPVVYVPGNHELYKGHLTDTPARMLEFAPEGCHVLNRREVVLSGVRFLGATLWTNFRLHGNQPLAMWDARASMSDFLQIRAAASYRKVSPDLMLEEHALSLAWLEEKLAEPFEGKTVVVTHHAPCELSISEQYRMDALSPCYASRLDHLFGDSVALWVHGHVHANVDYFLYGTRVVCNPRGYHGLELNPEFNPRLVLEP